MTSVDHIRGHDHGVGRPRFAVPRKHATNVTGSQAFVVHTFDSTSELDWFVSLLTVSGMHVGWSTR